VLVIVLTYQFGLAGAAVATTVSTLILHLYSFPRYVFTPLLGLPAHTYLLRLAHRWLAAAILIYITVTIVAPRVERLDGDISPWVGLIWSLLAPIVLYHVNLATRAEKLNIYKRGSGS
jgi:hypothetical protein